MRKKKETVEETLNEETTAKKKETTLASKKKTTTRKPRTTKKKAETTAVEVKVPVEEGSVPVKEETIPTEEGNAKMAVTEQNEVVGNVEAKNNPETGTTITEQKEVKPIVEPKVEEAKAAEVKAVESNVVEVTEVTAVEVSAETSSVEAEPTDIQEAAKKEYVQELKKEIRILPLPQHPCKNIIELSQAPQRAIILTDQQIQQLSLEEISHRHSFLEATLMNVLDYDVVISDTNIWLELLIGHTSSHSDPRFNARLQFERQLEFISKLTHYRGGRFMMMAETYEEIDRFACMQDPTNHREADWSDNIVCLNAAARLAKRLILAQQRENRLRIVGIGAESHHASFADPAIVRKVAELFAEGKKVLLLTNDASVAIRSMGICDDLQHYNHISDVDWDEHYAPLRPMVFTFDDLKLLDYYTRQYHYIQMAAGAQWMQDVPDFIQRNRFEPLMLCMDAFRPGDKHKGDNLFTEQEKQVQQQKQLNQNQQKQKQNNNQQQKQQQKQQTQQQKQQNQQVQQQKQQNQQAQQQKQQNQQAQQQKQKQQQQSETVNTQETAKESVAATQQAEMTAANKSANAPATVSDNTDKKPAEQKKNTSRRNSRKKNDTSKAGATEIPTEHGVLPENAETKQIENNISVEETKENNNEAESKPKAKPANKSRAKQRRKPQKSQANAPAEG